MQQARLYLVIGIEGNPAIPAMNRLGGVVRKGEIHPTRAREETLESRGIPCLFLNTERGFGGKPPKKSRFRRLLAGSKMPKEGSKMPKETFFMAISRWRVVSRRALCLGFLAGVAAVSRPRSSATATMQLYFRRSGSSRDTVLQNQVKRAA